MGASVAFDIQNLTKRLDTLDAAGPTSRNLQSAYALVQTVNSLLMELESPGAGAFKVSEDWAAVIDESTNRVNYEAAISRARAAITTAFLNFKTLVQDVPAPL